ncbi:hypothetical protein EYC84_008534 [Monilinia fructicola]|uniref:Uncharacterized protein n=1 Tax=Monilinia fructicola TaxID=38448 RepID=A0A5M9JFI1_MONFR|nr:hypothetical protein EYC84_008534 [Monilinia fructicola]
MVCWSRYGIPGLCWSWHFSSAWKDDGVMDRMEWNGMVHHNGPSIDEVEKCVAGVWAYTVLLKHLPSSPHTKRH